MIQQEKEKEIFKSDKKRPDPFGLTRPLRLDPRSQMYFDYEYGKASTYERPWSLNLGYRRLW